MAETSLQSAGTIQRKQANMLDSLIEEKPEMQMAEKKKKLILKENYPGTVPAYHG